MSTARKRSEREGRRGSAAASSSDTNVALSLGAVILVVLTGWLAYHRSFGGVFLFDDLGAITTNPTIKQLDWSSLGRVLHPPAGGVAVQNRPLVNLTLAINWALGGDRVWGYHAFNLAIHLLSSLLLLGLVRRTLQSPSMPDAVRRAARPLSLAVTLIWVSHPLNSEAVIYVIQRTELLMGMFFLLTLYAYVRFGLASSPVSRAAWAITSVAASSAGMACKETMVVVPVVAALYGRAFFWDSWRQLFRNGRMVLLSLAATWGVLLAVVTRDGWSRGSTTGLHPGVSFLEYEGAQLIAVVRYLRLSVWPARLVADYGDFTPATVSAVVAAAVIIGVLLTLTVWGLMRRPAAGFVGVWVFTILAPTSVIPILTEPVAERRMYLPLAGLVTAGVVAVYLIARRMSSTLHLRWEIGRSLGVCGLIVTVVAGVVATDRRSALYQSAAALWQDTVNKRPSARAWVNLGIAVADEGRDDQAIADYSTAIALSPLDAKAFFNRGAAYLRRQTADSAAADFAMTIRLQPDDAAALNGLSAASRLKAQSAATKEQREAWLNDALASVETAIRLDPNLAAAYGNRGEVHREKGEYDQAIADLTKAIELNPTFVAGFNGRARAFAEKGDYDRAIADCSRAIGLDPRSPDAYNNRAGLRFYIKGDLTGALADVRTSESLGGRTDPRMLTDLRAATGRSDNVPSRR